MAFLKKHWGSIVAVAGPLIAFLIPSINAYASAHPKELVGVIMATLLSLYNSSAPKDKS